MILESHETLWNECLSIIKDEVNDKSFQTWFRPIKAIRFQNSILTIQVPNRFFYDWIEEHYLKILKKSIYQVLGPGGRLEYKIVLDKTLKTSIPKIETKNIKNPFVIPGLKRTRITSNLNPKYLLNNYIEGDCNRLGRSAGEAISKKPGGTAFNPLMIYGGVGLGKTHLAQAIGNDIKEHQPEHNVLYLDTESFTTQIVNAIKNNTIQDLINHYQQIDVLIIDDIQFLSGREKTQDIFFNIFNQVQQTNKQIILTCDRPPKDLQGISDRLINRFKWGLTTDLKSPDFETRMAILQSKLGEDLDKIPKKVMEFICFNIKTNIRELEGVIISIMAHASLNDKEINIDLAKEVIQKFVTRESKTISVENITKLVADHFNVPMDKIHSNTRKREVVTARQLSMYLAKKFTNSSLKDIGIGLGGKDHSTVIYSINQIRNLIDTDPIFKDTVADIRKKVELSLLN